VPNLDQLAARWPRFTAAAAAAEAGAFVSVHVIPLRLRGQAIGAMDLFHRTPGPLSDADVALGQALADVATIGILQERAIRRGEVLTEQLQTALHSRVIIEQAKGELAQHVGVSMDTAFDRLRRYARANNLRLVEVARRCVAGELILDVVPPVNSPTDTGMPT
jgi:GAF domain-containing protein